jgi:shikimate kinase
MSGYYDHHPLVDLDRHLVVSGYFGAETRQIGYQLAALTGLGVSDLDRTIEHYSGKSIWELIWTEGEARYRDLERLYLRRLLAAEPRGVITLGDGTLIDDDNRGRVLDGARFVVLDLDLPNCYWRIKKSPSGDHDYWHPLYPGPVEHFEQVRPFYELRQPGFARAHHRIDLGVSGRGKAVDQLMELVG